MGNTQGALPSKPSSSTVALHRALDAWDESKIAKALENKGDPSQLIPTFSLEQFIVFAPDVERKEGQFALTALGRFASNLFSHLKAHETGLAASKVTREGSTRVLTCLLDSQGAGSSIDTPLHSRMVEGGEWTPGASTLVDALRLIVYSARRGGESLQRSRANFLLPTLLVTLSKSPHISALDFVFWGGLLGEEFLGPMVATGKLVREPNGTLQPLLIAAIDAGNAQLVKILLEACGVPPGPCRATDGGFTPLMRLTGDWAFVPPPIIAGTSSSAAGGAAAAADDSLEDSEGMTYRPTKAMMEALLVAGADFGAVDQDGRSALHHFAVSTSKHLRADPAGRLSCALRLVEGGGDANARDKWGDTPGQAAVKARPTDGARFAVGLEDFQGTKLGGGSTRKAARAGAGAGDVVGASAAAAVPAAAAVVAVASPAIVALTPPSGGASALPEEAVSAANEESASAAPQEEAASPVAEEVEAT